MIIHGGTAGEAPDKAGMSCLTVLMSAYTCLPLQAAATSSDGSTVTATKPTAANIGAFKMIPWPEGTFVVCAQYHVYRIVIEHARAPQVAQPPAQRPSTP